MDITIATFNVQNKYKINKYRGIDKYGDHVEELIELIERNKIDIIGTQELTRRYKNRLKEKINNKYKIVGKYRFTKIGTFISIIDKYNESNSIISNKQIIKSKTKYLPCIKGIPRIVTIVDIKIDNKIIKIINTHLDHISYTSRRLQLNKIYKIIKKSKLPVILLGDFNTTIKDNNFSEFLLKLKNIGYKRIEMNESTHKIDDYPIDHIIIPSVWQIKEIKSIKRDSKISDHRPIIVKIAL